MLESNYSNLLSAEIVKSWRTVRSNYIIVAPPLSNSRALLHKISSPDFINSILGDFRVSVAELDTGNYRCEDTFVDAIIAAWSLPPVDRTFSKDPVARLIKATERLCANGVRPIIVIHRFHEALEKLGEEIGTALRNLEHDFKLMTVVELPISLDSLRQRWMNSTSRPVPFLTSDWGQGHKEKFLKGYTFEEILELLPVQSRNQSMAARVTELTGGLTGLVDYLLNSEALRSPAAIDGFARAHAPRFCRRLLDWIDKPQDDLFKRLVLSNLTSPGEKINHISLADHDWFEILVAKDGKLSCIMLAWACAAVKPVSALDQKLIEFQSSQDAKSALELNALIQSILPRTEKQERMQNAINLIVDIGICATPYLDDWTGVRANFKQLDLLTESCDSRTLNNACIALDDWRKLADFMCAFRFETLTNANLRLEEFCVCSNQKHAISSYLFLLKLRLHAADQLSPYLALKSVVEQPESILQVFSYVNFGFKFWRFEGIDAAEAEKVEQAIGRKFFAVEKLSRLDFVALLYMSFARMNEVDAESKLLEDRAQMHQVESSYDQRKRQVHSTAIVSAEEWHLYRNLCTKWLSILCSNRKIRFSSFSQSPLHVLEMLTREFLDM